MKFIRRDLHRSYFMHVLFELKVPGQLAEYEKWDI
jgi:hypothetical protein